MTVHLLIGVPTLGSISAQTCASLESVARYLPYSNIIHREVDSVVHVARNRIVHKAVEQNATHLLMIDSDISFSWHDVELLVKTMLSDDDRKILGGLYYGRVKPLPIAGNITTNKDLITYRRSGSIVEEVTGYVGTGFLLIDMDVFKKLIPPFFYFGTRSEFDLSRVPFPNDFLGEDVTFCQKAIKAGFKIHLRNDLEIGHIGTKRYNLKDYNVYLQHPTIYELSR